MGRKAKKGFIYDAYIVVLSITFVVGLAWMSYIILLG